MISNLAKIALSQVGTLEIGGNNRGKKIREYQSATQLEPDNWPWCAAFVDWCVLQWLSDPANAKWLGLKHSTPEAWRPKTAAAYGLQSWAGYHPQTTTVLSGSKHKAFAGDIVVFNFSHTGIVIDDNGDTLDTVEGNTSRRDGGRDSKTGDGVWAMVRKKSLVRALVRIKPSTA